MQERFFADINEALVMDSRIRRGRRRPRPAAARSNTAISAVCLYYSALISAINTLVIHVVTKFRS